MPTTPGGHTAIQVTKEIAAIRSQTKSWTSVTHLDRPGEQSVMESMRSCSIAHFACYGVADRTEPAKSALLLVREVLERLTVKGMDAFTHDHTQIAYLSACSTAEIKVQNLADESIHLASAFQLSEFAHVIGISRAADDDAAVEIASEFYRGLNCFDGKGEISVARALHNAGAR